MINLGKQATSGARQELQLPFYGLSRVGNTAKSYFVAIGAPLVFDVKEAKEEIFGSYLVLQKGRLATLLVQNVRVGDDAVNFTYRARKNNNTVGSPVIIQSNAPGPVKSDLSHIVLNPGDTVGLLLSAPHFPGEPPVVKIGFTWVPL